MGAGRPTDYNDQVLKDSFGYIQSCEDSYITVGEAVIKKVSVPTIEGLAMYLEVSRSTIYTWQKEHPEFLDIIETLLQKQITALINNGLAGNYNSTIAKVLLAKHGYTDKQEIDQKTEHSGSITHKIDHSKLSDEALREIAKLDQPETSQD
jgi:hypothetical protein